MQHFVIHRLASWSAVRKSGKRKNERGKRQANGRQSGAPNVCENARSRGASTYDVTYNFENSAKRQRQERPGLFIFTSRTDPCQIPTGMVKVGQGNPWCLPCFPWVGCDHAPENQFWKMGASRAWHLFCRLNLYHNLRVSVECRVTSTTHSHGKWEITKDAAWLTFACQTASLFVLASIVIDS